MHLTTGVSKTTTKYSCVGCRPVAGQSRFVARKRTALDGLVWWCIFDQKHRKYLPGYRFKLRRECESHISYTLRLRTRVRAGWLLPFEPDKPNEQGEQNQQN